MKDWIKQHKALLVHLNECLTMRKELNKTIKDTKKMLTKLDEELFK